MKQIRITKDNFKGVNTNDTYQKYINDISKSKYDPISVELELEYCKKLKTDNKYKTLLFNANARFVVSVAKQYSHRGELMDLITEGNIGLLHAIDRFDYTQGFKLISYAVWDIRRVMLEYLNNTKNTIRLPQNKISGINKMKTVSARLEQKLERQPTEFEVEAEFLKLDYTKYQNIKSLNGFKRLPNTISYDNTITDTDNMTLLDTFASYDKDIFYTPSLNIELNDMMTQLKRREKYIIEHYYGINEKKQLSISSISKKLELTETTVNKILKRALKQLNRKNRMANQVLNKYL
jgi:RNA polymerase primary sigma factor